MNTLILILVTLWLFGILVLTTLAVQDEMEAQNQDPYTAWQVIRTVLFFVIWPVMLAIVIVGDFIERRKHEIYRKRIAAAEVIVRTIERNASTITERHPG